VRSRPEARTILLLYIISTRPSKQHLMVATRATPWLTGAEAVGHMQIRWTVGGTCRSVGRLKRMLQLRSGRSPSGLEKECGA
jgi:hypothetical protein